MTFQQPAGKFMWEEYQNSWYLIEDDIRIGKLVPYKSTTIQTKDKIERIKDGVFRIIRTCRNPGTTSGGKRPMLSGLIVTS